MKLIIRYKFVFVKTVYKLSGRIKPTNEMITKPTIITTKKGVKYLLLNKYKLSFVIDKLKHITAKKTYIIGKKIIMFDKETKNETIPYDVTLIKHIRQ